MADRSNDLALIDEALDAARVVDDFVRSVVELAGGELGGGRDVHRSWTQRMLGSWIYGEREIARGYAPLYDRDQLLKAAVAADELAAAMRALQSGGPAAARACGPAASSAVEAIAATLRDPETRGSSSELSVVHDKLARVIAALQEARTRALLDAMRSASPPDPSSEPPR